MKQITLILIGLLFSQVIFGQFDKHNNPVFNSELISEESIDDFNLTSNYYTIDNNISNKESSVYVSENPNLDDYLKFAKDLPAYYFTVHRGQNVSFMIMLLQKNDGNNTILNYMVLNPSNNKSIEVPCNVFGEISEKRAQELLQLNVDSSAKLITLPVGDLFLFNGITYKIQPYDKVKAGVIDIAKQLMNPESYERFRMEEYIKNETIGGKLDFKKAIESEGSGDSLFEFEGIVHNPNEYSIILWGQTVKRIGIKSVNEAILLWESIYQREMTKPEKKVLKIGFNYEKE